MVSSNLPQEQARQIVETLYRLIKISPWKIQDITEHVGLGRNYLSWRRREGSIETEHLFAFLEALDCPPGEFFALAFPGRQWTLPHADLLNLPTTRQPAFVRSLAKRALADDSAASVSRSEIRSLDWLRLEDPKAAKQALEAQARRIAVEDMPLALGIWASISRMLLRVDEGWHGIRLGLEIAHKIGDSRAQANLLQRAAYLHSEATDFGRALVTSGQACLLFMGQAKLADVGRTLVDQGLFAYRQGNYQSAESFYRSATALLPRDDQRNQFAVTQGLALSAWRCGSPWNALAHLETTAKHALFESDRGRIAWTAALAHQDAGAFEDAEAAFDDAVSIFLEDSPLDAAMVTCDQLKMLRQQERWREVWSKAISAARWITPLTHNQLAGAALRDLVLVGSEQRQVPPRMFHDIRLRLRGSHRPRARRS